MMTLQIDTKALNERHDVRELASAYTQLRKVNASESAGACPKCAGRDRFHAKKDFWFCRKCARLESKQVAHDAIGFVQWVAGLDFRQACERLGEPAQDDSRVIHVNDARAPAQAPKPEPEPWQDATWQAQAQRLVGNSCVDLDASEPARAWLAARGFAPATWRAYSLGFAMNHGQPAIAIPWLAGERGASVRAIHYRRLAPKDANQRYTSLAGSKYGSLFGTQRLAGASAGAQILVACEGELNAMAIWQAGARLGIDAVSFGHESGFERCASELASLAQGYQWLVIWCDKRELAAKARASLALTSETPGGKQDANDRLKAGSLPGFLAALRAYLQDRKGREWVNS